ncbi:ATP-dependent endonuclease [Actinocrinis puniceicyclus]|uniref:ATP-dependent endonuclease n=1 Tax=Actinocrinis puniceicyclus TaxID=977794 RepID=A0A8J8BDX1_9ACTN|nr:ATP-dependent endonuclease [Actinocrinis puniceicyclus]
MRAVVLVEGLSDRLAVEVLARRRGRALAAEGIEVVAMNGATNIGRHLDRYGPRGLDRKLAGLYDRAEERYFKRALERHGLGTDLSRDELEARGFFMCAADLEDELIRAVGAAGVEQIVEAEGEIASFRRLQLQPALRDRGLHHQLRRLMGGRSGGKQRYARLMAEAVSLDRVPRPLDALIEHI